ncbi:RNA polymerase, sigma subunit, ECF family [Robiginitalea myxolifaciens]|uniref:RNA polymerase sigma factor n=1 Tax=Robiginitalea myxolifaciens TaxID=400055 RepID=A0A1I6FNP6_9FLAO|nr:RNA polymerase sigma factor [Robiginitalea myxolifaciens]SFR31573.1 RNA polymerase, sigma subunit, ECF family [Robiginitalea myxolifaciens]
MTLQPTDKEIIRSVREGDVQAFGLLVDKYQHMVYTLAVRVVKNREIAEEVAQDAFVKAFEALEGFKGESKFSTWLYRIAYYRALDVSDREKRKWRVTHEVAVEDNPAASANTTWTALMDEERGEFIKTVLDSLTEEDRSVLSLHYLQELSLKEVGEIMGLQPNTVKIRLYRARQRMLTFIQEHQCDKWLQNYGS